MQIFSDLSGFPAELISSQLSFNGDLMKSYYSVTLIELYRVSASLDYIFMIGYGTILFSASTLIARRYKPSSFIQNLGFFFAFSGIMAAMCDGIENMFILMMLTDPLGFPNIWAISHSIFALIKWILLFGTIFWIIIFGIASIFYKR